MMLLNLRQEIEKMIEETGHYVLLQRTSRKIRCSCWNEKNQEADPNCVYCLGKGWVSRIERHKVRRQTAVNVISLPNNIQQTPIGQLSTDTRLFFFKHDTMPKKGDIIMEVGWKGQRPTHLIAAHEISHADDMREQRGRIEFFQVTTKEKSIATPIRAFEVRRMGPVRNYEPIYKKVTK